MIQSMKSQSCIPFSRSSPSFATLDCDLTTANYREQLNLATSYLDASQIYGTTKDFNDQLRVRANGLLRISRGVSSSPHNYLPLSLSYGQSDQCSRQNESVKCFVAGDSRTSENLGRKNYFF